MSFLVEISEKSPSVVFGEMESRVQSKDRERERVVSLLMLEALGPLKNDGLDFLLREGDVLESLVMLLLLVVVRIDSE